MGHEHDRTDFLPPTMSDLDRVKGQIGANERTRRRAELCLGELEDVDGASQKVYRLIGRMYVVSPLETVQTDMAEEMEKAQKDVEQLSTTKASLETRLEGCEADFRTLFNQIQREGGGSTS